MSRFDQPTFDAVGDPDRIVGPSRGEILFRAYWRLRIEVDKVKLGRQRDRLPPYDDEQAKVAEQTLKALDVRGISPGNYLAVVFRRVQNGVETPRFDRLATPKYLELFAEDPDYIRRDLTIELRSEQAKALARVCDAKVCDGRSDREAAMYVAATEETLSPLFRALLVPDGMPGTKTMRRLLAMSAALQYLQHPDDYDAVWGSVIPEAFRRYARDTVARKEIA